MITIYGSPKSSSGRCFWCLEEVGVGYETKSINFSEKEHKSEKFLEINPNGKVPALQDGSYVIWESMAINFYLADAYKPELLGKDVKERGSVRQWSFWAIADLQKPLIEIFIQLVFVPEERRNQKTIETNQEKIPNLLGALETSLTSKNFLVGNSFTLADLNTVSVVLILKEIKYDFSEYINLNRWMEEISERQGFQNFLKLYNK